MVTVPRHATHVQMVKQALGGRCVINVKKEKQERVAVAVPVNLAKSSLPMRRHARDVRSAQDCTMVHVRSVPKTSINH